jgi:hypothetical protein
VSVRGWYVAGMAICAAAIGDPLVESCANRGLLGGHYADNDHASVVPALLAGIVIAVFVGTRLAFARNPSRFARSANVCDIATIGALQFPALFAMESAENGRLAGGIGWLGGPLAASLALHLLIGLAVAAIAARFVHVLASAVRAIARVAIALAVVIVRARASSFRTRRAALAVVRACLFAAPSLRGRAPPFPAMS